MMLRQNFSLYIDFKKKNTSERYQPVVGQTVMSKEAILRFIAAHVPVLFV